MQINAVECPKFGILPQPPALVRAHTHTRKRILSEHPMNPESVAIAGDPSSSPNSLVFLSPTLPDPNHLLSSVSPGSKVFTLDSGRDSIQQISEILAGYHDISSVHILSHGEPGTIDLGTTNLNAGNLDRYRDPIAGWSKSLTDSADILLYGCDIARGESGPVFAKALSTLTGADVAASDDLTGNSRLGGDWTLEFRTGPIETRTLHSKAYGSVLHDDFTNFLDRFNRAYTAVKDGSWFDPATWGGTVPDNEAGVYIPEGRTVLYDGKSDARLKTVRVDGALNFATDKDSSLLVDTLAIAPTGKLTIGTDKNPVQADKTVNITFRSDTALDRSIDPKQFGKGLISHGQVQINGADKLDYLTLAGDAPAGSRELVLSQAPTGWKVGDRIVLGGTSFDRDGKQTDNTRFQDEVLTVTAINGNRVSFTNNDITSGDNTVLRFDHRRPEKYVNDYDLKLYVANTGRNVAFRSEGGEATPVARRGHVMFMENPNVTVNNAGFYDLGRTDKSRPIDDVGTNINGSAGGGTNVRGRYPLHFHRTGADDSNGPAVHASGNAIVGSPGWGITHHDSNAILENNVIFDVFGAGVMSEAGTELGAWRNNITIKTKDTNLGNWYDPAEIPRHQNYDLGHEGDGFWVQGSGAGLEITDNVAISAEGAGIDFHQTRFAEPRDQAEPTAARFAVKNLAPELKASLSQLGLTDVDIEVLPIRKFSGFETYNSRMGMNFYSISRNQDGQGAIDNVHHYQLALKERSRVDNFKLWNIQGNGINQFYSGQMDIENGLIAALPDSPTASFGVNGNSGSVNTLYQNLRIENFASGFRVPPDGWKEATITNPVGSSRLVNSFLSNWSNFTNYESRSVPDIGSAYPDYFQIINTTFTSPEENAAPTAKFTTAAAGGRAIAFDASASFDNDAGVDTSTSNRSIVAYGWDFNNDGQIDKFGRQVSYYFPTAGDRTVKLTVWDSQGKTATIAQTVNAGETAYSNRVVDGDFGDSSPFDIRGERYAVEEKDLLSNASANYGWIATPDPSYKSFWTRSNGAAVLTTSVPESAGDRDGLLGQVIFDDYIRRGQQQLNFSVKNTEGSDGNANKLTLRVWGVNGEFTWDNAGPRKYDTLSAPGITKLAERTIGGTTQDWTNLNQAIDFGNGYQFILVQVVPENVDLDQGDYLAIDNLSIANAPTATTATATISHAIAAATATRTEGNSGARPLTFTITRSGELAKTSSVHYTIGGTAGNGSDYNGIGGTSGATGLTGTVNFAANETSKTITLNVLGDTLVEPDETIQITLDRPAATGATAKITTASATTTIRNDDTATTSAGTGKGLRGQYFDNKDFTHLKLTRTDASVDFNWGKGSPDPLLGADTFSARWTGKVQPMYNEAYKFYATGDDGLQLWVNNRLVIDAFRDQPPTEYASAPILLQAGQLYDIRLDYYENKGGATARLGWSSPSQAKQIIPKSRLYS